MSSLWVRATGIAPPCTVIEGTQASVVGAVSERAATHSRYISDYQALFQPWLEGRQRPGLVRRNRHG